MVPMGLNARPWTPLALVFLPSVAGPVRAGARIHSLVFSTSVVELEPATMVGVCFIEALHEGGTRA